MLILSDNKIESLIGLERLTALRQLDLSRNEIASFDEVFLPIQSTLLVRIPVCLRCSTRIGCGSMVLQLVWFNIEVTHTSLIWFSC